MELAMSWMSGALVQIGKIRVFLLVLWLLVYGGMGCNKPAKSFTTAEINLRRMARKRSQPIYPEDALRDFKTGVAVAEIHLDERGRVVGVDMLEAPSISIRNSVSEALEHWRFDPALDENGKPALLSGKLTFYFEIKDGKGIVFDPADAGYLGRWPSGRN
jgi:TonB family protein